MINPDLWIRAEDETKDHRSDVHGFLYARPPIEREPNPQEGIHSVEDCQTGCVIWSSDYDDGSRYEELSAEADRQIRRYQLLLILARYEELLRSSGVENDPISP